MQALRKVTMSVPRKLREWPNVCNKKNCACDLIFSYMCYKDYTVCVGCRANIIHPHYKRLIEEETDKKFHSRIDSYGLPNLFNNFGDFVSLSSFIIRATSPFMGIGDTGSEESESASDD